MEVEGERQITGSIKKDELNADSRRGSRFKRAETYNPFTPDVKRSNPFHPTVKKSNTMLPGTVKKPVISQFPKSRAHCARPECIKLVTEESQKFFKFGSDNPFQKRYCSIECMSQNEQQSTAIHTQKSSHPFLKYQTEK